MATDVPRNKVKKFSILKARELYHSTDFGVLGVILRRGTDLIEAPFRGLLLPPANISQTTSALSCRLQKLNASFAEVGRMYVVRSTAISECHGVGSQL